MDDPAREDAADDVVAPRPADARAESSSDSPGRMLVTGAVGFGMGMADVVPGFSGGTVALLAGVYERLVANIRQGAHALALLARLRARDGLRGLVVVEWGFLLPLLAGILLAVALLAGILSALLETHPQQLNGVFLGLVLGATIVAAGDLRRPTTRVLAVGAVVALVAFVGLGLTGGTIEDPALPVFFVAGAVGVCAMILPGVSGAFLLVLLGMYPHVMSALADRDVVLIGVVGLGALVGLAGFSTLLNWLLREHHDVVLAALLGLMLGSSRVLWPWPGHEVGDPTLGRPVAGEVVQVGSLTVVAFVTVILVGRLARRATRP